MEREQDRKYLETALETERREKRKAQEAERKTRLQTIGALEGVLSQRFPDDYGKYADVINERLTRKKHEDLLGLLLQSTRCASLDGFVALL